MDQPRPARASRFTDAPFPSAGENNVIVRYLRFREGIAGDKGKCSVNLSGGSDMIFDHCSIEWGRWDCLGLTKGSHDITFQNCIIGEGVDPQRFGSLSDTITNITYSHNLWINNQSRNPKAKGRIQYVNNVVYNWGVCGLVGGHSEADHFLDAIGNYFIAGPNSSGAFHRRIQAHRPRFPAGQFRRHRQGRKIERPPGCRRRFRQRGRSADVDDQPHRRAADQRDDRIRASRGFPMSSPTPAVRCTATPWTRG